MKLNINKKSNPNHKKYLIFQKSFQYFQTHNLIALLKYVIVFGYLSLSATNSILNTYALYHTSKPVHGMIRNTIAQYVFIALRDNSDSVPMLKTKWLLLFNMLISIEIVVFKIDFCV